MPLQNIGATNTAARVRNRASHLRRREVAIWPVQRSEPHAARGRFTPPGIAIFIIEKGFRMVLMDAPPRHCSAAQNGKSFHCGNVPHLKICSTAKHRIGSRLLETHIASHPYFNSECECLVVFILNTRWRFKGHSLVFIGTLDTILCHPGEVFRLAIRASAAAIIVARNHPSGESTPSKATSNLPVTSFERGNFLKSKSSTYIVIDNPNHSSLRFLGCFYPSRSRLS